MVRALRPRQWVKKGLVSATPLAAGQVFRADVLGPTAVALVLFCVASPRRLVPRLATFACFGDTPAEVSR